MKKKAKNKNQKTKQMKKKSDFHCVRFFVCMCVAMINKTMTGTYFIYLWSSDNIKATFTLVTFVTFFALIFIYG